MAAGAPSVPMAASDLTVPVGSPGVGSSRTPRAGDRVTPVPVPVPVGGAPRSDRAEFLARALVGDEFHAVPSARTDALTSASSPTAGSAAATVVGPGVMITAVPSSRPAPLLSAASTTTSGVAVTSQAAPGPGSVVGTVDTVTGIPDLTGDPRLVSIDESIFGTASGHAPTAEVVWDTGRPVRVVGRVLIGRDPAASPDEVADQLLPVTTDSVGVSKTHLQLDVSAAAMTVTDRHSTNGVRVIRPDGSVVKCEPGVPTPVRTGDVVHFGGRSLTRSR